MAALGPQLGFDSARSAVGFGAGELRQQTVDLRPRVPQVFAELPTVGAVMSSVASWRETTLAIAGEGGERVVELGGRGLAARSGRRPRPRLPPLAEERGRCRWPRGQRRRSRRRRRRPRLARRRARSRPSVRCRDGRAPGVGAGDAEASVPRSPRRCLAGRRRPLRCVGARDRLLAGTAVSSLDRRRFSARRRASNGSGHLGRARSRGSRLGSLTATTTVARRTAASARAPPENARRRGGRLRRRARSEPQRRARRATSGAGSPRRRARRARRRTPAGLPGAARPARRSACRPYRAPSHASLSLVDGRCSLVPAFDSEMPRTEAISALPRPAKNLSAISSRSRALEGREGGGQGEAPLARSAPSWAGADRRGRPGSAASSAWRPRRRSSSRAALRAIPNSQARGSPRPRVEARALAVGALEGGGGDFLGRSPVAQQPRA